MRIHPETWVVQTSAAVANELNEDETVMLDIENGRYFGVHSVGKDIWDRISEPTRFGDLLDTLLERYEVDEETCRTETAEFLEELARQGLVDVEPAGTGA